MKIACIVGVRPNFVKLAGLIDALSDMELSIIHTGQHYDDGMDRDFWADLSLPEPDEKLEAGLSTTQMYEGTLRKICVIKPDAVIVVGDANSSFAGALAAKVCGVDVLHVEAGLRSFDHTMPEEKNRLAIDQVSKLLFVTEQAGMDNLRSEYLAGNAYLVGNVMIDAMHKMKDKISTSSILKDLKIKKGKYVLCTLHRPSNVDDPDKLTSIEKELLAINEKCPVVLPEHPRTSLRNIRTYDPMLYSDFIRLLKDARLVITDSGGVQEEALVVQTPCLTVRDNTERPVTLTDGRNKLVNIGSLYHQFAFRYGQPLTYWCPELWDGHASERIAKIIREKYSCSPI